MLGMIKEKLSSMKPRVYAIQVEWDSEAKMWVAYSDDIPGLATEAPDIEALAIRIEALAIDILNEQSIARDSSILAIDTKPMYFPLGGSTACG